MDEEAPAHASLRGQTALVTAACPRKYPRDLKTRKATKRMIPEDFPKEEFLAKFRKTFNANSNQAIEKATCHEEPHKRFRPSADRRERHRHIALKATGKFAHQKIAEAFHRDHGVRISFSFKLNRFVGNLVYLMEPGKKPSTDIDQHPARYPADLDLKRELAAARHPGDGVETEGKAKKSQKVRKLLTFDEVSNTVIEGIGEGPLQTGKALEEAARQLKQRGSVELWNFLGHLKTAAESNALVSKVWRLHGVQVHPLWRGKSPFQLDQFNIDGLEEVAAWRAGKWKSHALVLSGDGGLERLT